MAERGRPTASTDPYAALANITDPHLRAALKLVLDQVVELRRQGLGIGQVSRPLVGALDAAGHPLSSIADPVDPGDAVNLKTLQQYVLGAVTGAIAKPPDRPAPTPTPPTPAEVPPPPTPPPPGPVPPGPTTPPTPPPGTPPPPTPPPNPGGPTNPGGPWPTPQGGSGNLRISGRFFRTPGGAIYRWKSCSDFLLYKKYLDGTDITPIMADRTGEGATMVRVFGIWPNPPIFNPAVYSTYLASLPAFASAVAAAGLDMEFVVFAGAQDFSWSRDVGGQRSWLQSVRDKLLGSPNVVLELVNEGFQNGVNFLNHSRPGGIISCADSDQKPDDSPAIPPWDYATLHTPRDGEWMRKSKNALEIADIISRPAICDEPMGADEVDVPGRRSNNPDDFYYYAAVASLFANGATFHSTAGINSDIFPPVTRTCAQSFYAAIDVIPDNVKEGRYTRGGLPDLPIIDDGSGAMRSYCRYTDHNACVVRVKPTSANTATNGWAIASEHGPNNCVVILTK